MRLANQTKADMEIVELFSIFHDCRRVNEGTDRGHGRRAAKFAESLRDTVIDLDARRFTLLQYACAYHTDGRTKGDITVQTCWDADRLDLGRVCTTPDPRYLCTDAARDYDMIRWADGRAREYHVPSIVGTWGKLWRQAV